LSFLVIVLLADKLTWCEKIAFSQTGLLGKMLKGACPLNHVSFPPSNLELFFFIFVHACSDQGWGQKRVKPLVMKNPINRFRGNQIRRSMASQVYYLIQQPNALYLGSVVPNPFALPCLTLCREI
jgi:hypothetical protein